MVWQYISKVSIVFRKTKIRYRASRLEWWTDCSSDRKSWPFRFFAFVWSVLKWSLDPVVTSSQCKSCAHHAIFDSNNELTIKTYLNRVINKVFAWSIRRQSALHSAVYNHWRRTDDLEFVIAARGWSQCARFGNFEDYKRSREMRQFSEPQFEEARKPGSQMIKAVMETGVIREEEARRRLGHWVIVW